MQTKIILHGRISKIYGKEFSFSNIYKPMDAVDAINAVRPGFRKTILNEVIQRGLHYELHCDGEEKSLSQLDEKIEIKEVNIVPAILGMGAVAAAVGTFFGAAGAAAAAAGAFVGGLVTAAVGAVTAIIGAIGGALGAIGSALSASSFATAFAVSLAVGLVIAGIMYASTPIPEQEPNEASIRSSIKNSSYVFQNPRNVASQGKPVPIGYGRLRIGSNVIGTSITNFDLSNDFQNQTYESIKSNALLKIQASFGSSISNQFRGY